MPLCGSKMSVPPPMLIYATFIPVAGVVINLAEQGPQSRLKAGVMVHLAELEGLMHGFPSGCHACGSKLSVRLAMFL